MAQHWIPKSVILRSPAYAKLTMSHACPLNSVEIMRSQLDGPSIAVTIFFLDTACFGNTEHLKKLTINILGSLTLGSRFSIKRASRYADRSLERKS